METQFSAEQLKNPRLAEAEAIVRRCVHCGLCTATCSSYVVQGDERDSPRGRIYLIKNMLEGNEDASREVRTHVDRCLSCLSCMTTCPSGVDYMHLVDLARVHIEDTSSRPVKDRFIRKLLAFVIPHPNRFRVALVSAILARPFRGLFRRLGLKELNAMLDLAAVAPLQTGSYNAPQIVLTKERVRRGRVAMLGGCAQRVLRPQINDSTIRVLNSQGVDVVLAKGEACCGSLVLHMGREAEAMAAARRNIDAWWPHIQEKTLDAIVINASGCGTTVKEYGHLLALDPAYAEKAKTVSAMAKDVTEYLAKLGMDSPEIWSDIKVAYHSACSMQHGQRVNSEPRRLLREAGFAVAEIPDGHICCGSAGVYNILQSDIANELRERKVASIESVRPDCVATGNIGCITQLSHGTDIPVVHTVELLDWAHGGPCPDEIRHLANRTHSLREEFHDTPGVIARARKG
ncbi:MAG: glycolate oxidase subunit GlcF [Hyphomicrobiales bacterium]|nr:glycolate oxidase subunit GlcF [Hyphomicrobiales bacterium]